MSILLHEVIKLLFYIEATDTIIIRMGTSGGIGMLTLVADSSHFAICSIQTIRLLTTGCCVVNSNINTYNN